MYNSLIQNGHVSQPVNYQNDFVDLDNRWNHVMVYGAGNGTLVIL